MNLKKWVRRTDLELLYFDIDEHDGAIYLPDYHVSIDTFYEKLVWHHGKMRVRRKVVPYVRAQIDPDLFDPVRVYRREIMGEWTDPAKDIEYFRKSVEQIKSAAKTVDFTIPQFLPIQNIPPEKKQFTVLTPQEAFRQAEEARGKKSDW